MKKIIILTLISFSFALYNVGQTVSEADQNVTKSTCYAGNDYAVNDSWKLADWNGASNGGDYKVIMLDLETTW